MFHDEEAKDGGNRIIVALRQLIRLRMIGGLDHAINAKEPTKGFGRTQQRIYFRSQLEHSWRLHCRVRTH